jgi:hypothetical protein
LKCSKATKKKNFYFGGSVLDLDLTSKDIAKKIILEDSISSS